MPSFGRRYSPDARDLSYLMQRRLAAPADVVLPVRKTWRINAASLDQGNTSTCVGHAWRNFLRCAPIQTSRADPSAWTIYKTAVAIDPWADNDHEAELPDASPGLESGTTVRAGAEAVTASGHLSSYLWAFSLQPAVEWVLTMGPVVLGTSWFSSFQRPDAEGIVKITPTAQYLGGHAYLWRGVDTRRALALCENSWSDQWGRGGAFQIPLRDLETLIGQQGECCAAIQQKLKPLAVPSAQSVSE